VREATEGLQQETRTWTIPVVRRYTKDQAGQALRLLEAQILTGHGYSATPIGDDTGKLQVKKLVTFGAAGAAFDLARGKGALREIGATVISYTPLAASASPSIRTVASPRLAPPVDSGAAVEDALRRLVKLHDEGLVDDEEYAAKKADLLSRL
jgi:hypothetical protein